MRPEDLHPFFGMTEQTTEPEQTTVNISTVFFPSAILPEARGLEADIILCSSDLSYFYVHRSFINAKSSNGFGRLFQSHEDNMAMSAILGLTPALSATDGSSPSLPAWSPAIRPTSLFSPAPGAFHWSPSSSPAAPQPWQDDTGQHPLSFVDFGPIYEEAQLNQDSALPIDAVSSSQVTFHMVTESATVLNIVLHVIYGRPCTTFGPTLDDIALALESLKNRGVATPSNPKAEIWKLLLQRAASRPLQAMAIAALYSIEPVCADASRITLLTTLDHLSEAEALMMGPIYLRKLFFLHAGRRQALHRVIKGPLSPHPRSKGCTEEGFKGLAGQWAIVASDLVIDQGAAGTTTKRLKEAFGALGAGKHCPQCRSTIQGTIEDVCRAWKSIRDTI